jgi:hypothetical protein
LNAQSNACSETLFGSLKVERLHGQHFETLRQAKDEAETLGWRLGLSALVHLRFREWGSCPNGPALFEPYGKALVKSGRRFQKLEPRQSMIPIYIAVNKRPCWNYGCFCEI